MGTLKLSHRDAQLFVIYDKLPRSMKSVPDFRRQGLVCFEDGIEFSSALALAGSLVEERNENEVIGEVL